MDDSELKIQTFRPTWEEFKDFKKYIQYIESRGAHKAGLARIIPPPEFVPRRQGYNDLTKLKVIIKKPICQAVANVANRPGAYQQVNVPLKSMTVTDFRNLANSEAYRPPPHSSFRELEKIYWDRITSHAGIYGADVVGSISDKDYKYWNINNLNTILDFVGKDYDISIDGVNTAYLYFGMWKTTFGWHTEDVDLYSINLLHFGAPKSWYSIPPSYGRKFEKLCAALFPNSHKMCKAFLRHKMTVINPKWLDDYNIPYDRVTQEPGHIMITFPFGYHAGFNHGFNCAESTNFATERWINYGKHAVLCHCCPDSVKFPMDTFVKRFQPELYDAFKAGNDHTQHPEYRLNPMEVNEPPPVYNKIMSFVERNPDLNIEDILENPYLPEDIKEELRNSYLVSAEDEVAEMQADYEERMNTRRYSYDSEEFSDVEEKPKKRRKKQDSDYDDDWYEKTGNKLVSADGKHEKRGRGRPRKIPIDEVKIKIPKLTKKVKKSIESPVVSTLPTSPKEKEEIKPSVVIPQGTKVSVLHTKEKTVTVLSGKPSELPIPQVKPNSITNAPSAPKGPGYIDAFAQFIQQSNVQQQKVMSSSNVKKPPAAALPTQNPQQVSPLQQKSNRGRKKKEPIEQQPNNLQQKINVTQNNLTTQNQKVKIERIPQASSQIYAIQENTVVTQDGKPQKLYYTILNTPSNYNASQQTLKLNGQYAVYGQQGF